MQKENVIKSNRIFLLVAAMGVSAVRPIFVWVVPGGTDPWILRIILSSFFVLVLMVSFISAWVKEHITSFVYVGDYLISAWLIWLIYANNANIVYVFAYVLGFGTLYNYFDSASSMLSFTLANVVASFIAVLMVTNPPPNRLVFLGLMPFFHFLNYSAMLSKFKYRDLLVDSEESLKVIFDESVDALFLIDDQTLVIEDVNQQGVVLIGVPSREAIVGKKLDPEGDARALIALGIDKAGGKEFMDTVRKGEVWRKQAQITTTGGRSIWADLSAKIIKSGGRNKILIRISDISKIKESEQVLSREKEELMEMNKLMVGRELRMNEMKKEIQELKNRVSSQAVK